MGAKRIIIFGIAGIAALAMILIFHNLTKGRPAAQAQASARATVQVLVAKHDLPIGTRLAAGDMVWQPWPADALNPSFITDGHGAQTVPVTTVAAVASHAAAVAAASVSGGPMEALYGAMVHDRILANEPISNAKLLRSGDGGYMAVVLKPGMRAVAIPVSVNTAAGGFILPGDRVDVLQAHQSDTANGGKPGFAVDTLLRNVRVLAIDQATQQVKGAESMVGVAATLEVEDADAAVLARAKAQGEVILALRPFGDPGSPESSASAGEPGSVRIVRAGQVSDVMVAQ